MDENYVRYQNRYKKKNPDSKRGAHLKKFQWKKGESGNKDGRTTGSISITETLKKFLRRNPEALEDIVIALIEEGRLGNMVATKEMLDRVDGKVAETHRIEGELPVKLLFVPATELLNPAQNPKIVEGEIVGQLEESKDD